jgi:hypothetical protein
MLKNMTAHALAVLAVGAMVLSPIWEAQATEIQARRKADKVVEKLARQGSNFYTQNFSVAGFGGFRDFFVFLSPGVTHDIFASGCFDAFDVDITLFEPDGRGSFFFVKTFDNGKPFQSIVFRPKRSGIHVVRVHLSNATRDGAHIFFTIGVRRG